MEGYYEKTNMEGGTFAEGDAFEGDHWSSGVVTKRAHYEFVTVLGEELGALYISREVITSRKKDDLSLESVRFPQRTNLNSPRFDSVFRRIFDRWISHISR